MLVLQEASGKSQKGQGSPNRQLAELRRQLNSPAGLNGKHRPRLQELAQCLARVQALGDEYGRVEFSEQAAQAMT